MSRTPGITKRKTSRGDRYDIVFRDTYGPTNGNKQFRETYLTLNEAKSRKRKVDTAKSKHMPAPPRGLETSSAVTVSEAVRAWSAGRDSERHSELTAVRVESFVCNHLDGTDLGSMLMPTVTRAEVQQWVDERMWLIAPRTLKLFVKYLRATFTQSRLDEAEQTGILRPSPATRLSLPKVVADKDVPLTGDEVTALIDASPAPVKAAILLQAAAGLRIGELLAVRLSELIEDDNGGMLLRVHEQLLRGGKRGELKNQRKREVPLSAGVAESLRGHCQRYHVTQPGAYLFTTSTGRPHTRQGYGDILARSVKRSGLPENVTSHRLRHTFASWLIDGGESVVTVADLLGDSVEMVQRVYGHRVRESSNGRVRGIISENLTREAATVGQIAV